MFATLLSSSAVFSFDNPALSSSTPSEIASRASLFLTTAITQVDNKLVAVGDRGHIFIHGGQDWQQILSPSNVLLTQVAFGDKLHGWAVGHDATIINTTDGGNSWHLQQQFKDLDRPLLGIAFKDKLNGVAVGAYGMYFATSDGGKSWTKQFLDSLLPQEDVDYLAEIRAESEEEYLFETSSILPHFNHVSYLSDGRMMLVGELGLISFSADNGSTWQRLENIYEGSFFTSLETNKNNLIVAGLRGNAFRSTDGGINWEKISLPNNFNVNYLSQIANGDIYAAQNNGVILKSTDDGATFKQVLLNKGQDMMSVVQFEQQIWLAGSKGLSQLETK